MANPALSAAEAGFASIFETRKNAGARDLRERSWLAFQRDGLPNRRRESWHYTDLRGALRDFAPAADAERCFCRDRRPARGRDAALARRSLAAARRGRAGGAGAPGRRSRRRAQRRLDDGWRGAVRGAGRSDRGAIVALAPLLGRGAFGDALAHRRGRGRARVDRRACGGGRGEGRLRERRADPGARRGREGRALPYRRGARCGRGERAEPCRHARGGGVALLLRADRGRRAFAPADLRQAHGRAGAGALQRRLAAARDELFRHDARRRASGAEWREPRGVPFDRRRSMRRACSRARSAWRARRRRRTGRCSRRRCCFRTRRR